MYEQMVKKLIRLALASEYSRQPVRRNDISAKGSFYRWFLSPSARVKREGEGEGGGERRFFYKCGDNEYLLFLAVMAPGTGRQFKHVFEEAQHQLRSVFGMQLVELPQKEKISISQKRGLRAPPLPHPTPMT